MISLNRSVWQISGGAEQGGYADALKYGVALSEPGDSGPWRADRDDAEFDGTLVRRFATEIQIGDILLLRSGASTIRAVGIVASDYVYLPQFDDVNGQDLQHARRVRWFRLPVEYDFGPHAFAAITPALARVNQPKILDYAFRFVSSPPTNWQTAPLPPLPDEAPSLGQVPTYLQPLVSQIQDLAELYWDRTAFGDCPSEDEMLAHYIVPFLRALGWQPEQIAVKWRFMDVVTFRELPRTPQNCCYIVEAKRIGAGVEGALGQAKGYVQALGVPRDIVVTDGIRYRMYQADRDFAPVAYANLARLKQPALDLFAKMKRL